ncbi:MAG TPA: twin-arginine translocase subunit TatC [Anaerolineales bacterium]|nr:twin-arginine translocase subunit TatC [Anaerolineales bacterium]
MRRVLAFLRRIVTAPFRLVARPFRAIARFINHEPDESAAGDVLARTLEDPSALLEHLQALRGHLLRGLMALAIAIAISFAVAQRILDWLAAPIGGLEALQAIEVTESIGAFMRVSLLTGFALAFPYLIIETFAFVNPGLRRKERVTLLLLIPVAAVMFVGGLLFAYYVMLPTALPFLTSFMGITTIPRPGNYIQFVTTVMFWVGVAFEFPLLMFALATIGIIDARTMLRGWKVAVVLIAVASALITPTPDPINMALLMVPLLALYFLGVLFASFAGRRRRAKRQAA